MTDLKIEGENFRVEMTGGQERPAVVLIHALGADLSLWDAQMEPLLAHFRVVRYDLRGHGGSVAASGPLSIARHGRDLLAILDALDVERAHVVGLSLGGAIAQWLLAFAPERVERTILAATAAHIGSPAIWNGRIAAVLSGGMPAIVDATTHRWVSPDRPEAEKLRDLLLATSPDGYTASCAALRDMDLTEALVSVRASVLVLTGANDTAITNAETAKLLDVLSGARHVDLDGRHILPVDAVAAFTREMVRFLTSKLPTGRTRGQGRMPRTRATGQTRPERTGTLTQRARPEKRQAGRRSATTARKPLATAPPKVPVARPRKAKRSRVAPAAASPPGKPPAKQVPPPRSAQTSASTAAIGSGAKLSKPSAQPGSRPAKQAGGGRRRSAPASTSVRNEPDPAASLARRDGASNAVSLATGHKAAKGKPGKREARKDSTGPEEQAEAGSMRAKGVMTRSAPTRSKAATPSAKSTTPPRAAPRSPRPRPRTPSKPRS